MANLQEQVASDAQLQNELTASLAGNGGAATPAGREGTGGEGTPVGQLGAGAASSEGGGGAGREGAPNPIIIPPPPNDLHAEALGPLLQQLTGLIQTLAPLIQQQAIPQYTPPPWQQGQFAPQRGTFQFQRQAQQTQ